MSLGGGKAPTRAERERHDAIREIGCIASRLAGRGKVLCEVHHLTIGGKHGAPRRGHRFTVGLSSWHHRGIAPDGWTGQRARLVLGPSYAKEPRAFREEYGDDDRLLAYQDQLVEAYLKRTRLAPPGGW